MPLTNVKIQASKPKDKPYKLSDSNGLFLLINPNGSRYWRMKYRWAGKEKLLALGVYPEVGLADAREKCAAARKLLSENKDPSQVRREEKHRAILNHSNNFEALAREWHENRKAKWTDHYAKNLLRRLEMDIFPKLGTRPIAEITASELLAALRAIESRGALDIAHRAKQACGMVFSYAIATGRADRNPATDLTGALKPQQKQHYAHLKEGELPELLEKLENYDGSLQTKLALKMLLLTFVRTSELRGAEWTEIDEEKREWRIPAERMKMRVVHIVPLSDQALQVLEELKPLTGQWKYIFPNQHKPAKVMSENTMLYALYRMGFHNRTTGHGVRATASTILNEQGWKPDVIERQLAHVERNKVRGSYNHAQYLPDRHQLMQHWADYLDTLRGDGKVIVGKFGNKG